MSCFRLFGNIHCCVGLSVCLPVRLLVCAVLRCVGLCCIEMIRSVMVCLL